MTDLTREQRDALREAEEAIDEAVLVERIAMNAYHDVRGSDNGIERRHWQRCKDKLHQAREAFRVAACNAAKPLLSALTRTEQERDAAVAEKCVGRDKCEMCTENFSEGNSYGRANVETDPEHIKQWLTLEIVADWHHQQAMRDGSHLGDGHSRLYEETRSLLKHGELSATNSLPIVMQERDALSRQLATVGQERDAARAAVEKLVGLSRYLCTTVGKCEGCPRHETPSKCGMCSIPGLRTWAYAPAPVPGDAGGDV